MLLLVDFSLVKRFELTNYQFYEGAIHSTKISGKLRYKIELNENLRNSNWKFWSNSRGCHVLSLAFLLGVTLGHSFFSCGCCLVESDKIATQGDFYFSGYCCVCFFAFDGLEFFLRHVC